ncbi:MAG TPA: hypothetical protein ENK31_01240 [Nannocystis exedens]|nr:hypothetical protein [Nannocystis exedens]
MTPTTAGTPSEGSTTTGAMSTGSATAGSGSSSGGSGSPTSDPTTAGTSTGHTTTTTTTTMGDADGFRVGFDVIDVSPTPAQIDEENIYMGAYGPPFVRGPATGVHDPIFVRSMAIEARGVGFVMGVVDLPGMGNQNTRAIREMVADLSGLEEQNVLIGTTHNHSSPDFMGLWGGVPSKYRKQLNEQAAMSMVAAWEARQDAGLSVATGTAPNRNRRGWEFTDDTMIVLDARDLEGNRLGTLVNFAAHPVILGMDNKKISCDYTGYFVQALEQELAAPVVFFNGILGDVSPKAPDYPSEFDRAEAYGELLAGIAGDLVQEAEVIEPEVTLDYREWIQSVDNYLFQLAAQLGILQYDFDMKGIGQEVLTQSVYFRLGAQVQGVAFPGEPLTRNGLEIKEAMKAPHKIVLGNTGDALGYFVPSDEWKTGLNDDYEESVSLGKDAGDNARDAIISMIEADDGI